MYSNHIASKLISREFIVDKKHTPAPWLLASDRNSQFDYAVGSNGGATTRVMGDHAGDRIVALTETDFARAVACVNACASIPTYQLLEEEGNPTDLGAVIDTLRAKNEKESVTSILMKVVPGEDGMGHEVYAKSADQVVEKLTELSTQVDELEAQRDRLQSKIDWLQKVNTLHRSFETLYVVDGYHVTITWDGQEISKPFHGKTLDLAIEAAMAGYDLDAKPQFIDNPAEPECMLETNAKLLNALQALALFTKPTKSNAVVLNNAYQVISSATELSPPQPETFPKYIQYVGRIKRPDANQPGDAEGGDK